MPNFEVRPFHAYEFSCSFVSISKQVNTCRSPPFRPLPSSTEQWYVEIKFGKSLEVHINRLTVQESHKKYKANLKILIGSNNGLSKWLEDAAYVDNCSAQKAEIATICFLTDQCVMPHNIYQHFKCLCNDVLFMKGCFSFSELEYQSTFLNCEYQSTLIEEQKQMYRNSTAFDITFRLHDRLLKAHKCIVMSRSPVFAAMFEHKMLENITNEVPIDDIDTRVFNYFLLFLYTGEIEDKNWDIVLALYYAAEKYQVDSLKTACTQILSSKLDENNVCKILVFSDQHSDAELKESAKNVLLNCFSKVSSKPEWLEIVENSPKLASEVLGFVTKSVSQ